LGAVEEVPIPATASFLPDGGSRPIDLKQGNFYGLVGLTDGRLIGCPIAPALDRIPPGVLVISPNGRREVPIEVMVSPWLNHW
jgi:hypothetical protein